MAIEKKRMQQRYGTYQQFQDNINNLLPNEFASVVSDDPNTDSGEGLYFQCGSNTPKRILTEEDKSLPVVTTVDVNSDNDHIPTAKAVYDYSASKSAVNNINTEIQHIEDSLGDKLEEADVQQMIEDAATDMVSYVEVNDPNTATENGVWYKVHPNAGADYVLFAISTTSRQAQFRITSTGTVGIRRRYLPSGGTFPAWGSFEKIGWTEAELNAMIGNAAAYRTVTNLDDCTNPACLYEVTGRSLAIPVQPPYKVLCVKGEDYITQMIITTNSKVYLRMGTIDVNDNITFSAPDELCSRSYVDDAISSLEDQYIFVDAIPSNADHSKKYVLPDGYIWEWQNGTPGTTYNAANLANINKTAVTGSSSTTLAAKNGVITSDLIPWDSSWTVVEPPGSSSTVTISGISALVPVQYNSYGGALFIYYYRADGSYIEARRPATLNNVDYTDSQSIPLPYSFQIADGALSSLSGIGYIKIVLGVSANAITEQDVENLAINVPFYDVPATSGSWVNTGVKHPDYDHGLPDGGTAGQVLTKTADGEAWQDVEFSSALNVQSGQILYAVGDSITYGYGIGGNEYSWVKHVIQHNGYDAVNSRNLGQNGLGFCTNSTSNNSLANIIGATGFFTGVDIVTVALGINDWKNTSATLTAFWSGMEYCFDKIRTDNPYCKVFYILPFNASYMGNLSSYYCLGTRGDSDTSKPYGHTLQEFINMIKTKFEESTFKAFNVKLIDLTECPELNRRNITTALFDNLHPSAETNAKLGQDIARRIILY